MKTEYFCDMCTRFKTCPDVGKMVCNARRAAIVCSSPYCDIRVVYPIGFSRPKYCKAHTEEMIGRGINIGDLFR
jgi:hypothetical protein